MGQYFSTKKKRGQVWSLDVVIAFVIFTIGLIVLYIYAINFAPQSKNKLDELSYQGNLASEIILSENDYGIISSNRINQTKLDDLAGMDYNSLRKKWGLNDDFFFKINGLEINGESSEYFGKINETSADNLIKITRITVYKNNPTKFDLFVWDNE